MWIPYRFNQVPWILPLTLWTYHVQSESASHPRLAWASEGQGYTILPRFCQLLPLFHLQLLRNHHSFNLPHLQGYSLELLWWLLLSLPVSWKHLHLCSNPHPLYSRCFWLCHCWYSFHLLPGQRTLASCILLLDHGNSRALLWHPWQGTPCYTWEFPSMVTLPWRLCNSSWCRHWPQEPRVFYRYQDSDLPASLLVRIPMPIQPHWLV